jgi:hypothetical protein
LYTALLSPGSDDTLRLVEEVGRDVADLGSGALRLLWLTATALAVAPEDPDRALVLLDEASELATRGRGLQYGQDTQLFRGLLLLGRRRYAEAAVALSRALEIAQGRGNRRALCNALSAVVGLCAGAGREAAAMRPLAGLRATREHYGLAGSAFERVAEQKIEERLVERLGERADAPEDRLRDVEATFDLALDTLTEIAAGEDAR